MSADSPRRSSGGVSRGMVAVPAIVPPQVVSDRSILDSAIGFINEVTLTNQPLTDPKDTITWARFETAADISDPRFGEDWELEGNVAPPLLLILGYGLGVQVWAIPANGEAVEVLSWRHGIVSALRVLPTPSSSVAIEENGRADEPIDVFAEKRPLIALVDGSSSSGAQPQFCAVNFISLKTGTQVKTIKFKNPVIDILANRSSIVITFNERIAVFDARTLEDRLSITTCYPSPGINPNPVALGPRWLAYAEHKLLHSKRSCGGCDGDGVASYTATVLNASKSLVKGLRELGEQVAAGLTGTSGSAGNSKNTSFDSGMGPDSKQSGIITVIDVKNPLRDYSPTSGVPMSSNQTAGTDHIIAHFIAHSEALVSMEFDNSGMLLVTADRRGHDFHVFRIQPNPVGPSLAAVHHLYVLHRGDTSAKVQNISISLDSRWVAVSTLRGTTHVFPITPYGGPMGVRTHTSLHVVNKLSRFHRSAGLSAEGRSNSPISHSESTTFSQSLQPYHNPTLPPFPRPTVVMPLAQLRQPFALGSPPGSATLSGVKSVAGAGGSGSSSQRQRLSSLSDDSGKPLSVCAIFAKSRSWLLDPPNVTREAPHRMQRKAVDSLFVMAGHGALIQYDLDTKLASNVAKEKICDDTPIELEVEAKAQWNLGRRKEGSQEIMPPLSLDNWLVKNRNSCMLTDSTRQYDDSDDRGESWLAQVEIVTHAGPHRRLWMGPQFVFKTYNTPSGSNLSHVDIEAVEIGTSKSSTATTTAKPEHSSPLNMPLTAAGRASAVPVLIESGSYSSIEQSPKLMDRFRHDHLDSDYAVAHGDTRLKEDLADAMRESPSAASKDCGRGGCETGVGGSGDNVAFYDALTDHDDQDDQDYIQARTASAAALASALPNIHSYDNNSSYESLDSVKRPKASIEKIVNPLGTVTTVTSCLTADVQTDILDEVVSQLAAEDTIIHENCDESLFRPVVAIFCDEKTRLKHEEDRRKSLEHCQPPETISNKLVVPVIAKEVDDELNKKEKEKNSASKAKVMAVREIENQAREQSKFEELSSLNKKSKQTTVKEVQVDKKSTKIAVKEIARDLQKGEATVKRECEQRSTEKVEKDYQMKPAKVTPEKRKSPEKEKMPKQQEDLIKKELNTQGSVNKIQDEFEQETPIEFIRMTPKAAEKVTPQKMLSKKEVKKHQQQKTKDESKKQTSGDIENSIKTEVDKSRKSEEITKQNLETKQTDEPNVKNIDIEKIKKKSQENIDAKLSKENHDERTSEEKVKFVAKTPCENMVESNKQLAKDDGTKAMSLNTNTEASSTATTVANKDQIKVSQNDEGKVLKYKELPSTSEVKTKTQTALNVKLSAIDKTAIKEEIKITSQKVKDETKSKKPDPKDFIKTEQLNVKDLADSLIEPKYEKEKTEVTVQEIAKPEFKKDPINKDKKIEKREETPKKETPLAETVKMFAIPTKSSKRNKKKGNKSGSSSENEEIVEVKKTSIISTSKPNTQSDGHSVLKKKNSTSSEDSYIDWADNLLERKIVPQQTMFVSFTDTEVRKATKDQANPKEITKPEKSAECDKKKDGAELEKKNSKDDEHKAVPPKSSEQSLNVNYDEVRQDKSVQESKPTDKLLVDKEENLTKTAENISEPKKSEEKLKNSEKEMQKMDKKLLEPSLIKEASKEEKLDLEQQSTSKSSSCKKSDETTVLKATSKKIGINEAKPTDGLKKKDALINVHEEIVSEKNLPVKIKDADKKATDKSNKLCEKDNKNDSFAKVEPKTEEEKKNPKANAEKQEQRSKVEEPRKVDNKIIAVNTRSDKQESKEIKEKQQNKEDNKSNKGNIVNPKTKQELSDIKSLKEKQQETPKQEDIKTKVSISQATKETVREPIKKELSEKKTETAAPIREIAKNKTTPPASPQKKEKETANDEKEPATKITKEIKKTQENEEETGRTQTKITLKENKNKEDMAIPLSNKNDKIVVEKTVIKQIIKEKDVSDNDACEKKLEVAKRVSSKNKTDIPIILPTPPQTSAWKTLSGAEMINKNLNKPDTDIIKFPSLGAVSKLNAPKMSTSQEKLLPELPTPKEVNAPLCLGKVTKKTKRACGLDEFSILEPLESLPPLPALEPLGLIPDSRCGNFSLINFESPLQENPALHRKITPPPRGFTEQNLIFALCGSLHYENEHSRASPEKADISPTLSSNRSSSALDEPSMADYKSLTENDDPYISLEQSSQDTNTTNTNTTNEKFSSSTNSSGSEEIIIMEEKKMTKKQKRKRQQLVELQKQTEHQQMDDEELRPLIAMTESQIDQISTGIDTSMPTLLDESFSMNQLLTATQPLTHSTTTDSEGPMPATTSDDNVFTIPAPVVHNQHKIKTKKLEHKINLIAAIEAATSSSTSSAEESGVEFEGRRSSHDNDESLISVANNIAATTSLPLPIVVTPQTTVGALKKKTKRRKR